MYALIVESPAKCKTISKYLGKDYKILSSFGHIRALPTKKDSVDTEKNFKMVYDLTEQGKKVIPDIVKQIKGVKALYLATDPDREGEAISWHLLEVLKKKRALPAKVHRVVFNQITQSAIQEAIKKPRDIDINLVNAQRLRQALDYLVGFSISPILWKKLPGSRSAGRVQSVALRILCQRENEIDKFIPEEYWNIYADILSNCGKKVKAELVHADGNKLEKTDIKSQSQAEKIVKSISDQKFLIQKINKKDIKKKPPLPFITSTLQQAASSNFGFSAKKTMSVAQKLYEGVELKSGIQGLITYMRTDGIYIAQEAVDSIRDLVLNKFGKDYLPQRPVKFKKKVKNAQEAHESIRPTDILLTPEDVKPYLTADQIKLYSIIWQRTVASQMSDAVINSGSILLVSECGQFAFYASCSQLKFDGFYRAYPYSRDGIVNADVAEFMQWAECNQDSRLDIKNIDTKQNFTEPPRRYSEAGLIKKMEELGIGRPSTYATIISVLQDRLYALIQNKSFVPEARGRVVAAFLSKFFARYVEYTFTADLESDLDKVADGALDWMSLIKGFWKDFNQNVKEVDQIPIKDVLQTINTEIKDQQIIKSDAKIGDQCTKCKKGKLALNVGKFGVFLACDQYPDCKNTLNSRDDMNEQEEFPKNITEEITLNKGPYGIYLKYQDKNFSIPRDLKIEDINQELAKNLVSMPRVLGLHPKDGLEIKIGSGPYGLYILHNKKYYNFSTQELQFINLEKAVNIIDTKKTNTQEALKELGQKDGKDVTIKEGRYGPYIKYEKLNVAIPKNMKIDDITLEDAIELINKKMQKGTGSKKTNALKKK